VEVELPIFLLATYSKWMWVVGQLHTPFAVHPAKEFLVATEQKGVWAPEPVAHFGETFDFVTVPGIWRNLFVIVAWFSKVCYRFLYRIIANCIRRSHVKTILRISLWFADSMKLNQDTGAWATQRSLAFRDRLIIAKRSSGSASSSSKSQLFETISSPMNAVHTSCPVFKTHFNMVSF
jgi:hypothetical protein